MNKQDTVLSVGFLLACLGVAGIGLGIEHSGWALFVGLAMCWCAA